MCSLRFELTSLFLIGLFGDPLFHVRNHLGVATSNLEGTLAVGQSQASFGCGWIAALHLFGHFLDDGSFALEQTGPHPFVLRAWGSWRVWGSPAAGREQAFDDLLRGTDPMRAGEDGSYRGHALLVGLLPFGPPQFGLRAARLDHAVQNPFLESVQTIADLTGAAQDFDAFYRQRSPEPATGSFLVAAVDCKGIPNQDWSRANSISAGVVSERVELALVIC